LGTVEQRLKPLVGKEGRPGRQLAGDTRIGFRIKPEPAAGKPAVAWEMTFSGGDSLDVRQPRNSFAISKGHGFGKGIASRAKRWE